MPFGQMRPSGPYPFLTKRSQHERARWAPNENAYARGERWMGSAPQGRPVVGLPPSGPGQWGQLPMGSSMMGSSRMMSNAPPMSSASFVEVEAESQETQLPNWNQIVQQVKQGATSAWQSVKDAIFNKQQAQQSPPPPPGSSSSAAGEPPVPVPPAPKPMEDPMRAEYIWKTKRERNADMMIYKPTQTRYSNMYEGPFRAERLAQQRYEENQLNAIVFQVVDEICSRRMPKPFYAFCGQAMEKYKFIGRGLHWHDRPDAICMQLNMCNAHSYVQRGPHTTYRLD